MLQSRTTTHSYSEGVLQSEQELVSGCLLRRRAQRLRLALRPTVLDLIYGYYVSSSALEAALKTPC